MPVRLQPHHTNSTAQRSTCCVCCSSLLLLLGRSLRCGCGRHLVADARPSAPFCASCRVPRRKHGRKHCGLQLHASRRHTAWNQCIVELQSQVLAPCCRWVSCWSCAPDAPTRWARDAEAWACSTPSRVSGTDSTAKGPCAMPQVMQLLCTYPQQRSGPHENLQAPVDSLCRAELCQLHTPLRQWRQQPAPGIVTCLIGALRGWSALLGSPRSRRLLAPLLGAGRLLVDQLPRLCNNRSLIDSVWAKRAT